MKKYMLFTDGSVDNDSKIGFGACLITNSFDTTIDELKKQIIIKKFENTSSSKLEIQTLLWALSQIPENAPKTIIYTDSQNIVHLPERRERFEKNNYSTRKNKKIINADFYKEFFKLTDKINCELVKVEGHKTAENKDSIDRAFTLVDRASRVALRKSGL